VDGRIKEYRDKAEEVRRIAEGVNVPHIQEELLKIATQYDDMAAKLERGMPKGF